jgi:hypothetical protein
MPKPDSAQIQAAAQAAGIDVPYYRVEVEGDSFRFHLYGGGTVTVRALPGLEDASADVAGAQRPQSPRSTRGQRAEPQRPKPVLSVTEGPAVTITISADLATMTKAKLRAIAAGLGVQVKSKATKAQIIEQIRRHPNWETPKETKP